MPIKSFRPITPTRRFQTYLTREEITKDRPEKSLVEGKKRTGGRDARGPHHQPLSSAAAPSRLTV